MPKAVVLTKYGPPDVLAWSDVPMPEPGPSQVRVRVQCAGVSPTDPKIRRGDVQAVFRLSAGAVLGFEAAGVVDAVGSSVEGVKTGDEVACFLPDLGGYAEYALSSSWTRKPADVSWGDAAALPASAEAAMRVLKRLGLTRGETLLVLGAAGSVGMIATQLAVFGGVTVVGAAASRDHELLRELGAVPVSYGPGLDDRVREAVESVDAVLDAAGKGDLKEAVDLAGGPARVVTLADEHAPDLGVAFSVFTPDAAPDALDQTMALLAGGVLRLRRQRHLPLERAGEAHQLLESGDTREKLILDAV